VPTRRDEKPDREGLVLRRIPAVRRTCARNPGSGVGSRFGVVLPQACRLDYRTLADLSFLIWPVRIYGRKAFLRVGDDPSQGQVALPRTPSVGVIRGGVKQSGPVLAAYAPTIGCPSAADDSAPPFGERPAFRLWRSRRLQPSNSSSERDGLQPSRQWKAVIPSLTKLRNNHRPSIRRLK
jgi:hypothetical protein